MTASAVSMPAARSRGLGEVHALLGVQSLVVILVSVNRLSALTLGFVAPNEFLRWVDLQNMLTLPLISLAAMYLLKRRLEAESAGQARAQLAIGLLFAVGVYLLGAGYGAHEVTNYLHARFCAAGDAGDLCRIVVFNDDEFSHWVWFAGFTAMNAAILLLQGLAPRAGRIAAGDASLLAANALLIGAGIFANLAFEEIGADLYVVAALALLAVWMLWRRGPQPISVYYAVAYGLGLVATGLYKGFVG